MKIRFIYKIIPIFIFYTDLFDKNWRAGLSLGFAAVIARRYQDVEMYHQHELQHSRQFYAAIIIATAVIICMSVMGAPIWLIYSAPWVYPAMYFGSDHFRYELELAAYRAGIRHSVDPVASRVFAAQSLSDRYRLNDEYTYEKALRDLS